MGKLDGKVALITGAGRGMGRTHAVVMAEEGAEVVVQDIDAALAEESAAMIRDRGGLARVAVFDVSDVAAVGAEVAAVEAALGHIDILVNNAGIDTPASWPTSMRTPSIACSRSTSRVPSSWPRPSPRE